MRVDSLNFISSVRVFFHYFSSFLLFDFWLSRFVQISKLVRDAIQRTQKHVKKTKKVKRTHNNNYQLGAKTYWKRLLVTNDFLANRRC